MTALLAILNGVLLGALILCAADLLELKAFLRRTERDYYDGRSK